jgi:hypothetical protein
VEVPVVANVNLGLGINSEIGWYPNNSPDRNSDCNTLHARGIQSNSANADMVPYLQTDTLRKYFNLTYKVGGGSEQTVLPYMSGGYVYVDATPIVYSAWRGQTITTTQTFKSAILPGGCTPASITNSRNMPSLGNEDYFRPVVVADSDPSVCLPIVNFPNESRWGIFCFPVYYQVIDVSTGNPAVDLDGKLLDAEKLEDSAEKNVFRLAAGSYRIHILSDNSGANWNDMPFTIAMPAAWPGNNLQLEHRDHSYGTYDFEQEEDAFYSAPTARYG